MKTTLDQRINIATFLVATLVMGLFAAVIGFTSAQIEHSVLDQLVIKEYGEIQRRLARGETEPVHNTSEMSAWITAQPNDHELPRALRRLPVGIHHEVEVGEHEYHVMREPLEDGFLTLAYNIQWVEAQERNFKLVLLVTVLLAPALLLWLSMLFTRRMTGPVTRLADTLRALDPSQRSVRLANDFGGQEVEAIAHAFDRYQERLEMMMERELSFSAAASHELRSPLAVIMSAAELLEVQHDLAPDEEKQVRRVRNAASHMSDVVNSLLALSREGRQKPRSPLHISALLEEAIPSFRQQYAKPDVSLEYHCDEELMMWIPTGDFLIILGNLVQNALRNTLQGTVTVHCEADRLVVMDTGRGMPREFARHIFDKHVQAHDSHGVGLGLHIVKRLCDRYDWPMDFDSELGRGTVVTVHWRSLV